MRILRNFKKIAVVLLCLPAAWFLLGLANRDLAERQPTPLPIVLESIQALGNLHTTRYAYNNVFEYTSSRQPQEWVERIGMGGLVRGATRNRALVSAHGTVEAGVDLRKAQARYDLTPGGRRLVVTLPDPTVYKPHVEMKLHTARPGVFWRDDNLALKAQADAGERFVAAGREQGILESAREEARTQISTLLSGVVDVPLHIVFGS